MSLATNGKGQEIMGQVKEHKARNKSPRIWPQVYQLLN
jgi:hypothetical protein